MTHYLSLGYYLLFMLSTYLMNFLSELSVRKCSCLFCLLCVSRIWGLWRPYVPFKPILLFGVQIYLPTILPWLICPFLCFFFVWVVGSGWPFSSLAWVGGGVCLDLAARSSPSGAAELVHQKTIANKLF